jgi:hypothetical protein
VKRRKYARGTIPLVKRRLFNLLAGLSLLLCVGTAVLWVRSYWRADAIEKQTATATISALSDRGLLSLRHDTLDTTFAGYNQGPHGWLIIHLPAFAFQPTAVGPGVRWDYHLSGFWWQARDKGSAKTGQYTGSFWWAFWQVVIPYPAILVPLAILLALAIRQIRLDRSRSPGLCSTCGYDLRATPDRCPECGTVPKNSPET